MMDEAVREEVIAFDLSQFEKTPVFVPDNQIGIVLSRYWLALLRIQDKVTANGIMPMN